MLNTFPKQLPLELAIIELLVMIIDKIQLTSPIRVNQMLKEIIYYSLSVHFSSGYNLAVSCDRFTLVCKND